MNEAEVGPRLQQVVNVVMGGILPSIPVEQRAQVQQLMTQLLSPQVLLSSVMQQAQLYFNLHGGTFTYNAPIVTTVDQPNPLGGPPMPAKLRVSLESVTGTSATVRTTTAYDPAALFQSMRDVAERAGAPLPTDAEIAMMKAEVSDEGRFVLDRTLGILREATNERRVAVGTQSRLDRMEIRLVREPVR